jgi:hypothetical protein
VKIFVGWPYDAEWVDRYVLPLIETYGIIEIVCEGQDQFIYTNELPADFFNSPDAYLEVEVNMGGMQWLSPGIRFNALEVPLENLSTPQFNAQRFEVPR